MITIVNDICTECGRLTIGGSDPIWFYGSSLKLTVSFITHNCEGDN